MRRIDAKGEMLVPTERRRQEGDKHPDKRMKGRVAKV